MAQVFYTNGDIKTIEPKNGTDFTLEELNEHIDGYIEAIAIRDPEELLKGEDLLMLIDEDGKLKNLPANLNASRFAHNTQSIQVNDYIVGNAILCRRSELI